MCTELQQAIRAAAERGMEVTIHAKTHSTMIDGMRWDYWMRLKDTEVTTFRGKVVVKET